MKPSLMPYSFWNASPSALRILTTSARFTSLNEVSMAIEFFDCIRRSAMRARMRVIGTRSSGREPGVGFAAGGAAAGAEPPLLPDLTRSSLVTRPSRPVPVTLAGSMSCSVATRRPAGERSSAPPGALLSAFGCPALAGAGVLASGFDASCGASLAGAAAAPSSMIAMTCSPFTVSPTSCLISFSTPSTGEGTSSTTLSVSRSTRFSSRATASPAFLCQLAMVASETDSGRTGTLSSMDMTTLGVGVLAREREVQRGGLPGRAVHGDLLGRMIRADRTDQGLFDQRDLFGDVGVVVSGGRRRRARTTRVRKAVFRPGARLQVMPDLEPGPLVHRFLLAPDHLPGQGIPVQLGRHFGARERIQLLDAGDGDVRQLAFFGVFQQVVIDLARAQHQALDLLRRQLAMLGDHQLEAAVGELVQRRHGQLVAQQ